jgi:hypothetical protein
VHGADQGSDEEQSEKRRFWMNVGALGRSGSTSSWRSEQIGEPNSVGFTSPEPFLRDESFWCVINVSRGCWVLEPGSRKQRFPGMHIFVLDFPETHLGCAKGQLFETGEA